MNPKDPIPPLLLLAAGRSQRMGQPKGLLAWREGFWIDEQLRRYLAAGGAEVWLILGPDAPKYVNSLSYLQSAPGTNHWTPGDGESLKIRVLVNALSPSPVFTSIHLGLNLSSNQTAVFIQPIDVPLPQPEILLAMHKNLPDSHSCIQPARADTDKPVRLGHPVLLGADLARCIASQDPLAPDSRLDVLLYQLPSNRATVPCAHEEPFLNLNSPELWDRWKNS